MSLVVSHSDLHEKAQSMAQSMTLSEVREVITASGILITAAPSGRFGSLTKFADYAPATRTITLYGDLSESDQKLALIHEWLHAQN